jgi:FAD/FMN-containing dehydrogenase
MTATLHTSDPVLLAFAEDIGESGPVAVAGSRTRWGVGGQLTADTRVVSDPSGIVEYNPEEMTATVRTGTTVAELHEALAAHGQWTALPERGGTVGGAIAIGQNDFRRPARGDVRSAVLQVRYVSAEGQLVAGGGPTVKNVSGFDLPRLLTGSLGTLGCIAEVIIRTNPIPPTIRWFVSNNADPFEVHGALLAPGTILWDGTNTTVMLFGHEVAVDADRARLQAFGAFEEAAEPITPAGHRWSLAPSALAELDVHETGSFVAEIGIGVVHAEHPQPPSGMAAGVHLIHERMKAEFDPTGRFNPGRIVGAR